MKKKILSLVLALTMIFGGIVPAFAVELKPVEDYVPNTEENEVVSGEEEIVEEIPAMYAAQTGYCGDYLDWEYEAGVLTIFGEGAMYDYTVKSSVFETKVDTPWFNFKDSITSVVIEDATTIGDYAFYGCSKLASVTIADSVESIGDGAFYGCSALKDAVLPKELKTIGTSAFENAGLNGKVILGEKVTSVGEKAFKGTSITEVGIPAGVEFIGIGAFCAKEGLVTISVAAENENYVAVDNVLFSKDMKTIMQYPSGAAAAEYTVPYGVEKIESYAFAGNNIKTVVVPESVTLVERHAFTGCTNLGNVTFGGKAPEVYAATHDDPSFDVKTELNYVAGSEGWDPVGGEWNGYKAVPLGFVEIASGTCGDNAEWSLGSDGKLVISGSGEMYDYAVKSVLPTISTTAPWDAYKDVIKEVSVEDGITSVGAAAFYGCEYIEEVELADSVKEIGNIAFYGCKKLAAVKGAKGLVTIGNSAFARTSITEFTVAKTVTSIGTNVFDETAKLASIKVEEGNANYVSVDGVLFTADKETLIKYPSAATAAEYVVPRGVKTVEILAFENPNLARIYLPESFEEAEYMAFSKCESLKHVYFRGDAPKVSAADIPIASFGEGVTLYYISGTEGWTEGTWNGYTCKVWEIDVIASGTCGEGLTWTLDGAGKLIISGAGKMDDYDILSYDGVDATTSAPWDSYERFITSISIGNEVTSIGDNAFYKYENVGAAVIGTTVESIGQNAFYGCEGVSRVILPETLKTIGDEAFAGTGITDITVPASVTSIGNDALKDTDALANIKVIEGNANYASVDGVLFSADKKALIKYPSAKEGTSYEAPAGVETVESNAFDSEKLTSVTLPDSLKTVEHSAFIGCENLKEVVFNGKEPTVTEAGSEASSFGENVVLYYFEDNGWTVENEKWNGYTTKVYIEYLRGDVNEDGVVNARDSQRLYEHLVGKKPLIEGSKGLKAADVNEDGMINARDSQRLYEHLVGKKPFV